MNSPNPLTTEAVMLTALQEIVDEIDQCNGGKGARLPFSIHIREIAVEAIRKAKGEL